MFMNKKIGLKLNNFEQINDKQFYLMGNASLLIGHIIYLLLFHWMGVIEMERYNYFSVAFYAVMLFFIKKYNNQTPFILLMIVEIIIHAGLSTLYLGWSAGFGQFMLCIISIPFYLPIKLKFIPYILSVIDISIFIGLKFFTNVNEPLYDFANMRANNIIYITNSVFSCGIIVFMASNYIFTKNAAQKKMEVQNEELQRLAMIDPLTELFNRRAMMNFFEVIQNNSLKTNSDYIIGLGDIDDFKKINDSYGHTAGDEVLKAISEIFVRDVPAEGYVCRWGGEEILFAIPNTNMEQGMEVSKKISNDILTHEFTSNGKNYNVSITIGVTQVSSGSDLEIGIKTADKRLYDGKEHGKKCVVGNTLVRV